MMEVLFFEEANAEIEEGRAWYRRRSEVAEAALLRELNHAIEMVAEAPFRWAKYIAGTSAVRVSNVPLLTDILCGE